MKFKINNREWKIIELSQEEIKQHMVDYKHDGEPENGRYYGQTYFSEQKIYIDQDLHIEQKKQTLLHELIHFYIGCFLFQNVGGDIIHTPGDQPLRILFFIYVPAVDLETGSMELCNILRCQRSVAHVNIDPIGDQALG